MTRPLAAFMLASFAVSLGFALIVTQGGIETAICAKSQATCEAAREAIRMGRWPIAPPDSATACEPRRTQRS